MFVVFVVFVVFPLIVVFPLSIPLSIPSIGFGGWF